MFEKVVSFLKKTSPQLVRRVQLYRDRVSLFDAYALQPQIDSAHAARRRAAVRRLHRHRPHRGADGDRRQHRPLRRQEGPRGHHPAHEPRGGRRGRPSAAPARHRRDHRDRLHRHGGPVPPGRAHAGGSSRRSSATGRSRASWRSAGSGSVEMTRKNVTDGLYGVLTEACPTCHGEGRVLSSERHDVSRWSARCGRSWCRDVRRRTCSRSTPRRTSSMTAPGPERDRVPALGHGKAGRDRRGRECSATEVRVLIEGRAGLVERAAR